MRGIETNPKSPCDTIIKLVVGAQLEAFNVHQGLLCATSEFFKRALKPEWTKQKTDPYTIDLSEDSREVVALYVRWLYRGELQLVGLHETAPDFEDTTAASGKVFNSLAAAYTYGEKIMDVKFKNAVVLKFLEAKRVFSWYPSCGVAKRVYQGTPAGSPLRRLLIDIIASNANTKDCWKTYFDKLTPEILLDVMKRMVELRPSLKTRPYQTSPLNYLEEEEPQVNRPYPLHFNHQLTDYQTGS